MLPLFVNEFCLVMLINYCVFAVTSNSRIEKLPTWNHKHVVLSSTRREWEINLHFKLWAISTKQVVCEWSVILYNDIVHTVCSIDGLIFSWRWGTNMSKVLVITWSHYRGKRLYALRWVLYIVYPCGLITNIQFAASIRHSKQFIKM